MDRRFAWLLLVALAVLFQACARQSVIRTPPSISVLTDETGPRVHADASLLEPAIRVSSRLIAAARRSEFGARAHGLCWRIALSSDHGPSRTFVTPNGAIVVSADSFRLAQTEAGLAALLSHELIHALVDAPTSVSPPCTGSASEPPPAIRTYEEELRADELGLKLMAEAGYDPGELLQLWERMKQQTDNSDAVVVHLTYDRRMDRMAQWWKDALMRYERANRAPQKALPAN